MATSLKEVEALVDALEATDKVRLMQYLIPQLASALLAAEPDRDSADNAWREFRCVGERLAATSNGQSITQAITDMRRYNSMLTIDASVWVNADSPSEPESAASRLSVSQIAASGTIVFLPTLLQVEVAAAISRTRKDAVLARDYSKKLAELPFVRWISLDNSLAVQASALAAEHGLRGADAVYAAVATAHGCDLVSLDREHLSRLASVLKVSTPSQLLPVNYLP